VEVRRVWVGAFLVLAACASSTRHPGGVGSALATPRSATVSTRTWRHWLHQVVPAHGWITSVDSRPVFTEKVELRPGFHTLVVERDEKRPAQNPATCGLSFQAQPGHHYRATPEGRDATWHATLTDEQGGVPVPCVPLRPAPLR
jgi:hypothetical protein